MYETQGQRVQCLTRACLEAVVYELLVTGKLCAPQDLVAPVALVVEERVPQMLHVGADLMRAPRFEHTFHQGDVAEALQHAVMRHGMLSDARVGRETAICMRSFGLRAMLPSMRPPSSSKLPHTRAL